jgi:hypothetical protein
MENFVAVAVAVIVSAPAFLAWRSSQNIRKDVATNHGMRPGEYLELIAGDINALKDQLTAHTLEDHKNFTELRKAIHTGPTDE